MAFLLATAPRTIAPGTVDADAGVEAAGAGATTLAAGFVFASGLLAFSSALGFGLASALVEATGAWLAGGELTAGAGGLLNGAPAAPQAANPTARIELR